MMSFQVPPNVSRLFPAQIAMALTRCGSYQEIDKLTDKLFDLGKVRRRSDASRAEEWAMLADRLLRVDQGGS